MRVCDRREKGKREKGRREKAKGKNDLRSPDLRSGNYIEARQVPPLNRHSSFSGNLDI